MGRESGDQSHQERWCDLGVMVTRVVKSQHELWTEGSGARNIQCHFRAQLMEGTVKKKGLHWWERLVR